RQDVRQAGRRAGADPGPGEREKEVSAMAQPFKKQTVRSYTPGGERCGPDVSGAVKRVEESRKYYGLVPQPDGRREAVPLCPDLGRSKQLLNKLLADAALRQHG